MHRRFRICASAALMGFLNHGFAQEPPLLDAAPAPTSLPTPGKHQLKASPLQIVQHLVEQQNGQIAAQGSQIGELGKKLDEQGKQLEALKTQIETSTAQVATLHGQIIQITELLEATKQAQAQARAEAARNPPQAPASAQVPASPESAADQAIPRAMPPESAPAEPAPPHDGPVHVVKRGENLTSIARQHGTTVAELLKLNKIEDERKLQIGQTLFVPAPQPAP